MAYEEAKQLVDEYEKIRLQAIEGKTSYINIEDSCQAMTIQAFKDEFHKNGMVITSEDDYGAVRDRFTQLSYLKKFDARVNPEAKIEKTITNMVRQAVHVMEKGKRVTKDALYYNAWIKGENYGGVIKGVEYDGGYYYKPVMSYQLRNPKHPFDPETGKKIGEFKVQGTTIEHTLFVPESKTERKKFFQDLLDKWPDTFTEELEYNHLIVRQAHNQNLHSGPHGGKFSWSVYTCLGVKELAELQESGYFKDSDGILKDSKLQQVNYNQATGKMEAIR